MSDIIVIKVDENSSQAAKDFATAAAAAALEAQLAKPIETITPADVPDGTGVRSWNAVEPGVYPNCGGITIPASCFAIIKRDAAGAFSFTKTDIVVPPAINKIIPWTATSFASGDQVNHLGKDWVSNAATVSGDVPGTSVKWVERLTGYLDEQSRLVLNPTETTPLASGLYYNSQTARTAAQTAGVNKLGLILTYLIGSYQQEFVQFEMPTLLVDGNIHIILDGVTTVINLVSGDTSATIGGKVRATAISGWTLSGSGNQVFFTKNTVGACQLSALKEPQTVQEIDTITITSGASSNGDVLFSLDGEEFTIPVLSTDNTAALVATKIVASSFDGWTITRSGAVLTYKRNTYGKCLAPSNLFSTCGVTATVVRTVEGQIHRYSKINTITRGVDAEWIKEQFIGGNASINWLLDENWQDITETESNVIEVSPINLINYKTNIPGWLIVDGTTNQLNEGETTDFIKVKPNTNYWLGTDGYEVLTNEAVYNNLTYVYDINKNPLTPAYLGYDSTTGLYTTPSGCYYVRLVFAPPSRIITPARWMFIEATADFKVPEIIVSGQAKNKVVSIPDTFDFRKSKIGAFDYQSIVDGNLNHIIMYSQSKGLGWQAQQAFSTTPVEGTYMLGTQIMINRGNATQATAINPLIGTVVAGYGGETPLVSAVHHLKTLMNHNGRNGDILATNAGEGGKSIEELSKEYYSAPNLYTSEYLTTLNSAKAYADSVSKTISCPAIVYMQGESNYFNTNIGLTNGSFSTTDKDTYKALLLTLKNNLQADAMTIYGQTKKPLFFLHQISGWIKGDKMNVNMAMLELAEENDDIIIMNPSYHIVNYGAHFSCNGYRWYGETIGKAMGDVLLEGNRYVPMKPIKFEILNKIIRMWLYVPCPPLVADAHTVLITRSAGFTVHKNGREIYVESVELGNNFIDVVMTDELDGEIEISYAAENRKGQGNVRDSDTYTSLNYYVDDSAVVNPDGAVPIYKPKDEDGNDLYGQKYPMQNWLSNFYYKIK